jgi:hypothetical protein
MAVEMDEVPDEVRFGRRKPKWRRRLIVGGTILSAYCGFYISLCTTPLGRVENIRVYRISDLAMLFYPAAWFEAQVTGENVYLGYPSRRFERGPVLSVGNPPPRQLMDCVKYAGIAYPLLHREPTKGRVIKPQPTGGIQRPPANLYLEVAPRYPYLDGEIQLPPNPFDEKVSPNNFDVGNDARN